ncbi:MAG: type III-A CRISPR-associated protein Cas10/Csm1 [Candidatus Desulfofervidus auxilii]|nr:type III-A CRISPR-associated protein Cas10/Csm1 [Candidatus Desulfofervidus auxilii]
MEDKILYKIILASLLHDIGKVYLRAQKDLPSNFVKENRDLYQPFFKGHYTHTHVLYTAKFIEDFRKFIPEYFLQSESADYSLINLAASHHKPNSPWQLIICEADKLSSAYERREFEEKVILKKGETSTDIPLLSLFEDIRFDNRWKEDKLENYHFAYKIAKLSPENIFAQERTTELASQKLYQEIINSFEEGFKRLPFKKERVDLWLESLTALMLEHFLFIPSATVGLSSTSTFEKIPSDISLYDHSYFTASLASTLYLYHKKTNSLNENQIKNRNLRKFLFIEGNFYGIQKFIFSSGGETRRWAAKLLRGRSFMVSLYTELVAEYILKKLELPFVSLLSSAAGKFLILAPNFEEVKVKLKNIEQKINDWLYEHYYGETSIGLVFVEAKPSDLLYSEGYNKLMKLLGRRSEERKYEKFDLTRYGGVKKDYFDKFSEYGVCKLCGKRPAVKEEIFIRKGQEEKIAVCLICNDQIKFGEKLVKNRYLLVYSHKTENTISSVPILDFFYIEFKNDLKLCEEKLRNLNLLHVWDLSFQKDEIETNCITLYPKKFINAYIPRDSSSKEILTFEELSRLSLKKKDGRFYGIDALGVLKADVDNLGIIFYRGFRETKRTFSRYLSLSRMLNFFFAYYLPYLCQKDFKNIYNVFCGGDDLFIIGPWYECYKFALKVNELFRKYVCENPAFTLSAGYVLTKPNLPITELAKRSERALKFAKNMGKNRLYIFKKDIMWTDIPELENLKTYLENLYEKEILSRTYLYKLNEIIEMVSKAKKMMNEAKEGKQIEVSLAYLAKELKSLIWPSLFYYFTVRNFDKKRLLKKEERSREMEKFLIRIKEALENYREAFRLPLWQILYSTRRVGHEL